MLLQSISRNSIMLGIFAVTTTAIIAATSLGTREKIRDNVRHAEARALVAVIPDDRHDNAMVDDTTAVDDSELLGLREAKNMYFARQGADIVAVILPATARDGYTGDIDLIVGINRDGTVAGVRVLSHRETPGLGDQVDYSKSHWVDDFIDKSLTNPQPSRWKVKKDKGVFDQFTGATITPRAVTKAVKQALEYFAEHRDNWWPQNRPTADKQQATDSATQARESDHG